MPRVNVDDPAFTDPRIEALSGALGFDALGPLVRVWHLCYQRRVVTLSGWLIDGAGRCPGLAAAMLRVDLATEAEGGFHIAGAAEHVRWLIEQDEKSAKAVAAKRAKHHWADPQVNPRDNPRIDPGENPPSPSPSPSPALEEKRRGESPSQAPPITPADAGPCCPEAEFAEAADPEPDPPPPESNPLALPPPPTHELPHLPGIRSGMTSIGDVLAAPPRKPRARPPSRASRIADLQIPEAVRTPEVEALWRKRAASLSELGKLPSTLAAEAQIERLAEMGPEGAAAALEYSMSYQGLFPPPPGRQPTAAPRGAPSRPAPAAGKTSATPPLWWEEPLNGHVVGGMGRCKCGTDDAAPVVKTSPKWARLLPCNVCLSATQEGPR